MIDFQLQLPMTLITREDPEVSMMAMIIIETRSIDEPAPSPIRILALKHRIKKNT